MPTAPTHAQIALDALISEIDEIAELPATRVDAVGAAEPDERARVDAAIEDAMARLAAADRLAFFEAATQRLAAACVRRQLPQPARSAAYAALVGLIASDLLPPATFRTLYEAWEAGLDGRGGSSAIVRGEEVLLHIE